MKLNSTENMHGIMQGFSTLTADANDGCRTAVHNGVLYCVYLSGRREIMYMIKRPNMNWENPVVLEHASARNAYSIDPLPADAQSSFVAEYITRKGNLPSLVSFNNLLWLIYTDDIGTTVFRAWSENHATFLPEHQQELDIEHSASFAQLNNTLYMFYKYHGNSDIYYSHTSDMEHWSTPFIIKTDHSDTIASNLSPVAITYQGLIHLFYKDQHGGFFLLKSDGEHWTSPIAFISGDYLHSPGITVHNGLLKLAFCSLSHAPSTALYQYTYDGNALGPVVASMQLRAGGSPALNTQDGKLIATYLESDPTL